MNNDSLPMASSPKAADNTEVLSRRISDQGETVPVMSEDKTLVAEHMGGKTPMDTDDGGRIQFGPQPNAAPETQVALDSSRQPLPNEGSKPPPTVTSVQPEAPDNLLEALRGTSIMQVHCILMSTVIQKVQSIKSGLDEACSSLLTGFQVSGVAGKIPI